MLAMGCGEHKYFSHDEYSSYLYYSSTFFENIYFSINGVFSDFLHLLFSLFYIVCSALIEKVAVAPPAPRADWFKQINGWKNDHPFHYGQPGKGKELCKGPQIVAELYRQVADRSEEVICTTGVGCHQMWAAQYYRWRTPRSFITSGGSGTMGFGLPSAIGAQIGAPDCIVVDIDGDASFSMTCQELLTAVEYNIPVKILVINNNVQGMVRQWQDLFYDKRHSATDMSNPSFKGLAEGMGAKGLQIRTADELEDVMAEFIGYKDGPVVLDAICEKQQHVYPMVRCVASLSLSLSLSAARSTRPVSHPFSLSLSLSPCMTGSRWQSVA